MSDETTLLPCPWCGEYPKLAEDGGITGPWFCVWHDCPPVENGKARHYGESLGCISITTVWFHTEAEAIAAWNTRASDRHPYEQRITGDGSDWGEIMRDAYDSLMASACESCTPEQMSQLSDYIRAELGSEINGDTSDGYHTFNELYHHRAVLFSVIVRDHRELAWKARKHHDGTMYDGMFIVGIETPKGQATYHYDLDPYWEMFDCEEREFAPEWDGHTPDDAIARIAELGGYDDYEAKMDALLCRLTNGKWSKSRAYDLDFMVSCVDEEYEMLYARELADMVERDYVKRDTAFDDAYMRGLMSGRASLDDEFAELTAERDELEAFSERLETAAHDKLGVTLFGVDYVTEDFMLHVRDTLTAERDEALEIRDNALGDAVTLKYERDELTDKIGEIADEVSELMKKQPYTFAVHDVPGSLRTVGRYIDELTAERDEWKAKCEQAQESYLDAKDARDTWMAKYKDAERAMNKAAGKWARADTRSAKRAAAAERLKNDIRARFSPDAIVCALLDGRRGKIDWSLECEAILDLLTDKPMDAQRDSNGTCPDAMGQSSTQSKAHSKTEPNLTEQPESLSDETDSRKKLEADIDEFRRRYIACELRDIPLVDVVRCWLDRQAGITEREVKLRELYKFEENHRWHIRSIEEVNQKLNERIDEQQAHINELTADVDNLTDELSKRDKGIARLKQRRDELLSQLNDMTASYDLICRAFDAQRALLKHERRAEQ